MKTKIDKIKQTLKEILGDKDEAIESALVALFCKGHLLIEDLPGLGKTTLALGISKCLGLEFSRIQATTDLLPSDITGVSIYNQSSNSFEFHRGSIFANIVLVDEINRATPKSQSALLESMAEHQVTAEGNTYNLPEPFFLIATANPTEQHGTFELPESQLDRFDLKISLGYPSKKSEKEILKGGHLIKEKLNAIKPILNDIEINSIQYQIKNDIFISDNVLDFILELASKIRGDNRFLLPLSIRGTLSITNISKTLAYFDDRDYVTIDDVKKLLLNAISHRVILKDEFNTDEKITILQEIIDSIKIL